MIKIGDKVSFVDGRGITWFGIAESTVKRGRNWPVIRVRIGRRVADVPARDVNLWPTAKSNPAVANPAPASTAASNPAAASTAGTVASPSRRTDPAIPKPRGSVERPPPGAERTPSSPFILGDMVTLTEAVNDGWRRRVPRGTRGIIIGRVRDGEFIVQFTSGRAATALACQLRPFAPPVPGRTGTPSQLTIAER